MLRILTRVQLAYIGLFVLVAGFTFAYQAVYIWPVQRCEQHGGWWSAQYRQCATPIPIWRFTGRLPTMPGQAAAQQVPGQLVAPKPALPNPALPNPALPDPALK